MSETEMEGPDPNATSLAEHSTYDDVEPEEDTNPPTGHHTEQTLGTPGVSAAPQAKAQAKKDES